MLATIAAIAMAAGHTGTGSNAAAPAYELGVGIADATGPISDVIMMGMANPNQINAGLHTRLFARALAAHDPATGKRFVFVSLDAGMGGIVLKNRVVAAVAKQLPGMYTDDNIALSGTHTHSGPSGFLEDVIFQFAGSGWQPHTINAMVDGVVASIVQAHNNLAPARASLSVGELRNASINRSPSAYLFNPKEEQAMYTSDTDLNMTVLRIDSATPTDPPLGMFTWFAVHPTSMNNTNVLVSGDNKGYASYVVERQYNGRLPHGKPPGGDTTGSGFVAAFASTNLGDVSPNILGPHCRDTGLPCDFVHSTCNNRTEMCSAFGPGKDMFDSTRIIGQRQADLALKLFNETTDLGGGVDFKHAYVKMPGLSVNDPTTGKPLGTLCPAAMGDSFAAGTIDGPGMFDFTQGANSTNPFWHIIRNFIHKPTPEEMHCQAPKDILLPTGSVNIPWPWAPDTLPVQLLRLGQLVIIVAPTELTTMAGRRLRAHIRGTLVAHGVLSATQGTVVIAGLANGYADYTTTYEEYQEQRYEGGSTIYGPHQLNAYIQEFTKLAVAMATNTPAATSAPPVDFSDKLKNSTEPTIDVKPNGVDFGGIIKDVSSTPYAPGSVASATFSGGNPVNNLKPTGSFAQVQKCASSTFTVHGEACSAWETIAVDADWETRVHVTTKKEDIVLKSRTWEVQWYIPEGTPAGTYQLVHHGVAYTKPILGDGKFTPYTGTSSPFTVQ